MEKSSINDASSSKSTSADHSQRQQLSFQASALLTEVRRLTTDEPGKLPVVLAHLATFFRNFVVNYEQLILHASDLTEQEFRLVMLLDLTMLDTGSDNRLIANLHQLVSGYEAVLMRNTYLTEFVFDVVLCICLHKQGAGFKDIVLLVQKGLKQPQLALLLSVSDEHIQSSNLIRTIVLSKLYSKLCEIGSFDTTYRLLLLTSVVVRVDILSDDIIESLLDGLVDTLENMERRLNDEELTVLLNIMTKNKWREEWIEEGSTMKGKPVNIEFRLQKIVNVAAKKLIREKDLKNRNAILKVVLRYFNSNVLLSNESLLEAFILGLRKEADSDIQEILRKIVTEAVKGQPTLKLVKSIIKNMKISTSQKNSLEVEKIVKNFELLEVVRKWNDLSHQALQFSSRLSAVYFEGIGIKSPFTIMMEIKLKARLFEQGYLITLVGKKNSISMLIRRKAEKKDYFQLKVVDNNDPKFQQDTYEVEAPCDKVYLSISMSDQNEGLLVTVNNLCFLVHLQLPLVRDVIVGNNIVNGKLAVKCAIQELHMFCILNEFHESSQLFCRFRTKELTTARFKESTEGLKTLVNLNIKGEWVSNIVGGGVFGKFFHAEEIAQPIECCRITKPSLLRTLQSSGNLDVFLLLIEYYSIKAKESEFLVLTDCILGFILLLLDDDEKIEMRKWLFKSLPKLGLAIWIISYSIREKNDLISKIMSIACCFDGQKNCDAFNFECMRTVLLNFQIWRNFCFEDQLAVLSVISKNLTAESSACADLCIEHNQLRRLLIATIAYYKLELTPEAGIKRRLTKQQLLRLQLRCRQIFTRCICANFKPIVESRNRGKISKWIESARSVFQIAVVVSEPVIGDDNNPYYSKQSLLEMLRVIRKLINNLSLKETYRLFQEMLSKDELFRSVDAILMMMLENQAVAGGIRFKKNPLYSLDLAGQQDKVMELEEHTIIDIVEDILLDVLLIKQYNVEAIAKMFEGLRRRERDPIEISYIFKLIPKLQQLGLPGVDLLYGVLLSKTKDNLTIPSYYLVIREEIVRFLEKLDGKFAVDVLNGLADLLGDIMRQECENRQLAKLVLRKYLECERMEPISPIYFVHINRIAEFPDVSVTTPAVNIYKLGSVMEYKEFIAFLSQNWKTIRANDNQIVSGGIISFVLARTPMLPISEVFNLTNLLDAAETPPAPKSKPPTESIAADLILLRAFRRLSEILQAHEQHGQLFEVDLHAVVEIAKRVFNEAMLDKLFREIVFEGYNPTTPKIGLSFELESFYKMFASDQQIQLSSLSQHREIAEKIASTIEKYAERPLKAAITQAGDKLTLAKYQPKPLAKHTGQSLFNSKSINVEKARQTYDRLRVQSFNMLSDYFEDYQSRCLEIEQSWKRDKQLNYYWQYFTYSKESNFYSVDNTFDSLFSRINIKVSSNDNRQQFPRRKGGSTRFRLSSQNNSSISKSEPDNDIMMKSMVFDNIGGKKSNHRKQSEVIEMEKEEPNSYYCELVKPEGVYFGKFQVVSDTLTFHSNPNEDDLVKKDIYMELSTSEHLRQKKEKKRVLQLCSCTVFTRRYILRHTAIEVFHRGKAYFFNFFLKSTRDEVVKLLKKKAQACIISRKHDFEKEQFTERWRSGRISNFEYLMKLNLYSGRSYNDLSQYPVFPWVLKNYKAERVNKQFLQDPSNYRDLTLPMGRQDEQRFEEFVKRMNDTESQPDSTAKFLYGSFYSNPTIITHYLIRLEPFATLHWKHQSKRFDHADRLFSSIEDQYTSSTKNTSDLKQLIPEFYSWPQFLRNRNQLEFGRKQNKTEVNHVECPNWASCPEQVIFRFREALESEYASKHLHKWIDLIFGWKSKQANALAHNNLFHQRTYEHDIFGKTEEEDEDDIRLAQTYVSEFGQVPQALFDCDHPPKQWFQMNALDIMYVVEECPECTRLVLSNEDYIMALSKKNMLLIQVNILQLDSKTAKKQTVYLESAQKKFEFISAAGNVKWAEFSKSELVICSAAGLKNREVIFVGSNMTDSVLIDQTEMVTAEESRLLFRSFKDSKVKVQQVSHCHQDQIYILEYCRISDVLVSVDRDNVVGLHYGKRRSKIRAFNILLKPSELVTKIRVHPLGLIFFWTNQQRLKSYSFTGDRFFGVQFRLPRPGEQVTQLRLFSVDKSILLFSSNKGFIYPVDIFEVYRWHSQNPRLPFQIEGLGLLGSMMSNPADNKKLSRKASTAALNQPIVDFDINWTHRPFWKLAALYEKGKLCFYMHNKEKEQRIHEQITEMGFS